MAIESHTYSEVDGTGDGANYKAIATKNNIINPDKIYVVQKLVI